MRERYAPLLTSAVMTDAVLLLTVGAKRGPKGKVVFTAVTPATRASSAIHAGSSAHGKALIIWFLCNGIGRGSIPYGITTLPEILGALLGWHARSVCQELTRQRACMPLL